MPLPLGIRYLEADALHTAALNAAYPLAIRTCESVRVGTLFNKEVLIVHHVLRPDNSQQALDIGAVAPVHATALGKALLTHSRHVLPALAAEGLQCYTSATVTDVARLRREVGQISKRGWAAEIGQRSQGVASIAEAGRARSGAMGSRARLSAYATKEHPETNSSAP